MAGLGQQQSRQPTSTGTTPDIAGASDGQSWLSSLPEEMLGRAASAFQEAMDEALAIFGVSTPEEAAPLMMGGGAGATEETAPAAPAAAMGATAGAGAAATQEERQLTQGDIDAAVAAVTTPAQEGAATEGATTEAASAVQTGTTVGSTVSAQTAAEPERVGTPMASGNGQVPWTTGSSPPTSSDAEMQAVYANHASRIPDYQIDLGSRQWATNRFASIWEANQDRYERIAAEANVPAALIAALHFRESSGDFNTYLHNGQRLGQVTTIVPTGVYFTDFEEAAVDALGRFTSLQRDTGLTQDTMDLATIATFAEYYNGLGYHRYRDSESPYVYAGTDVYSSGKYVADGQYSTSAVDAQLGVLVMFQIANGNLTEEELGGAAISYDLGDRTLRNGSRGSDVRELQTLLNSAGVETGVDGSFGPNTEASVRAFQTQQGLTVDGVVGPATLSALRAAAGGGTTTEEPASETQTDTQTTTPATTTPTTTTPTPEVDTTPTTTTPTTGTETGSTTTTTPETTTDVPQAEQTAPFGTEVLRQGASGENVRALQAALAAAGISTDVDGQYGPGTAASVRAFQTRHGLTVDGIAGPQTLGKLSEVGNDASSRLGTANLRSGAEGDEVRALQQMLSAAGIAVGVDGDFGPLTEEAVRAFQAQQGLAVDGVVGPNTMAALRGLA